MKRQKITISISCALIVLAFTLIGGCRKPVVLPAKLTISVEGEEFSNALVYVDGDQIGHLAQTLIKANGELYVDGVYSATLPAPEDEEEARTEDEYSGVYEIQTLAPREHTIALQTTEGKLVQITANIRSGAFHLLTYRSDENKAKWDQKEYGLSPGQTITVK